MKDVKDDIEGFKSLIDGGSGDFQERGVIIYASALTESIAPIVPLDNFIKTGVRVQFLAMVAEKSRH